MFQLDSKFSTHPLLNINCQQSFSTNSSNTSNHLIQNTSLNFNDLQSIPFSTSDNYNSFQQTNDSSRPPYNAGQSNSTPPEIIKKKKGRGRPPKIKSTSDDQQSNSSTKPISAPRSKKSNRGRGSFGRSKAGFVAEYADRMDYYMTVWTKKWQAIQSKGPQVSFIKLHCYLINLNVMNLKLKINIMLF